MREGQGNEEGVGESVVNSSRLANWSCLLIIRVAGLHHASHLYMIWLLICLVNVPIRLSEARPHYGSRAVMTAAPVWEQWGEIYFGDVSVQQVLEYEREMFT